MMMKLIGTAALVALLVVPASADEAAGKKKKSKEGGQQRNMAVQMLKQFEAAKLTETQTAKVKEMAKKLTDQVKTLRADGGITNELMKKRTAAQKELRDSGKKGKELMTAVNEAAGLSEAQVAVFGKISEIRMKFQKEIIALLTPEQKELLPARLTKSGKQTNAKKEGKKGGKKKDSNG
ncbi:hypothetical protein CA13_62990 [Planctomycetes bacterium CA13]|uniref:Periplasmic heavy metal sensor n=1 Tax=Novipirellula herctigrandis TaxID=2527986 RepID=A0A5C5ZCF3_9BACT|nr:hypothetical protein CA13_62990 [Planctomycetes bacterium CA13]